MNELDTATRGHHPDSPSGLQSSAACPHFTNRNTDSEASKAGTLQHKAAETRDLTILEEPEHFEAVKRALAIEDFWINAMKGHGATVEIVREKYLAVCPDHKIVDEQGRQWSGITGGYPDTLIVATFPKGDQLIVVLDWKFGKMLVTPTKENLQGKSYALAALQEWPKAVEAMVVFFHPHIEVDQQLPEYTHTFTREDMPQMEQDIRLTVARKRRAKAEGWTSEIEPVPCTNLCIWCQHLNDATCPKMLQLAAVTYDKHQQLAVPTEVRPSYLSDPAAAKQMFQLSKVLEELSKNVRRRLTDMVITEGFEMEGMRVVTKADREVASIAAVRDVAFQHGLTVEQFEQCLNLPITTLEKAIKASAPKGKGAAKLREFQADLEDCGAVKKGRPYSYLAEVKEVPAIDV